MRLFVLLSLSATVVACGGSQPAKSTSPGQPAKPGGASAASNARASNGQSSPPQSWQPSIPTAAAPKDPCEWIPVAEVETVLGKLAAPPRKADGCRYTLVMPEAVTASRQKAKALQERVRQALGTASDPALSREITDADGISESDPRSYAVTLAVDVDKEKGNPRTDAPKAAAGWDEVLDGRSVFSGRVGHIRVTVTRGASDVPSEPLSALAARVRDRIPDLPFAVVNPYQVPQSVSKDPCSLLTRAEAETVLGPLAIDPYRSSSYWPPLAHGDGHACAYFTPGHHVFVLSPTWQGGVQSFKIDKGIGGLIGQVAPQDLVVLKGPWDKGEPSGTSGALLFLKGDQLLEVTYRTSRATLADAVKLAAIAMPRLAP